MAEWLMATVCKTVERNLYTGSNPVSAHHCITERQAYVAQSVEHILGKNEVNSSILFIGFPINQLNCSLSGNSSQPEALSAREL